MPTLWPAGPWRFEAAVTITGCNEQSVTNWLQIVQIAASARLRASPTWMKTAHRSTCSGSALDAAVGSARPGFAHIELTRAGAAVGSDEPWPGGAEDADREPAGAVECELGDDPAEQCGELACVSGARAEEHALRSGHVAGGEVPVGREVIAAGAGV